MRSCIHAVVNTVKDLANRMDIEILNLRSGEGGGNIPAIFEVFGRYDVLVIAKIAKLSRMIDFIKTLKDELFHHNNMRIKVETQTITGAPCTAIS